MDPVHWLLDGTWTISGHPVLHREVFGNVFGLASAILGMRRLTWAWPVGIVGNVVLFTVFVSGIFDKPQAHDLWGQAGRQVFFLLVSLYGWWRWHQSKRQGGAPDGGAIVPRWARAGELRAMILAGTVMMFVFFYVLRELDSFGPLPDAWILTGSILATYGMARGYVDFWWVWIGVDIVGVPLLYRAEYYPSAVMYAVYGAFCLGGFVAWARAERRMGPAVAGAADPEPHEVVTHA